jgi:hypothetical protein
MLYGRGERAARASPQSFSSRKKEILRPSSQKRGLLTAEVVLDLPMREPFIDIDQEFNKKNARGREAVALGRAIPMFIIIGW